MNERTSDILQQVFSECKQYDDGGNSVIRTNDAFQLFAELLVLETVRYIKEDYTRDFSKQWRDHLSECIISHLITVE